MPEPSTFKATDIIGLCVIMGGLCMYRFGEGFWENMFGGGDGEDEDKDEGFVKKPLLSPFAEGEGRGGERRGAIMLLNNFVCAISYTRKFIVGCFCCCLFNKIMCQ